MPRQSPAPRYLENLGLFTTFRCQVACAHCAVQAGPNRTEVLRDEDAADWMTQAAAYRGGTIRSVNLTGGEPFFDLAALRRLVELATERGLVPTAVTNAWWAVTPGAALETLRSVPGLLAVQISADEHHQARIPFDRVRNAIRAAQELGLVYSVAVCTESEASPGYRSTLDRLLAVADLTHIRTVITFHAGRAACEVALRRYETTAELPRAACGGAATPVVFPDGRVLACSGPLADVRGDHPLVLGDLRRSSLAEILDAADASFAVQFVRVWGPGRLAETLASTGFDLGRPSRIVKGDVCGVCRWVATRPQVREALRRLSREADWPERLAWARLHYLGEDAMVRGLGLAGAPDA